MQVKPLQAHSSYSMADGHHSGRHGAFQGHASNLTPSRRSVPEHSSSTRTASGHPSYADQGVYTSNPHYPAHYNHSSPAGLQYVDTRSHVNPLSSPPFAQPYPTALSPSSYNYATSNVSSHATYQSSPGPAMRPAYVKSIPTELSCVQALRILSDRALPSSFLGRPNYPTDHHLTGSVHTDHRVSTSAGVVRNHM